MATSVADLAAGAALLAAGYLLGRVRLWERLDTWVWRRFTFGGPWTRSRRGQAVTLAAHVLVRPGLSWRAWRHRNDPPTRPAPAPRIRHAPPEGSDQ